MTNNDAPEETTLATIPRGPKDDPDAEQLRIMIRSYRGYPYLDLRVWYQDNGVYKPTKKGISIKPRELREVFRAVREAGQRLFKPSGG